eukprot:TRINITY_DN1106_c3_g1_i1.p1 TRINITY_DN1106_c3_g1~~TRINITY_DN1106_c3_g1_i1.p1  ORF type:complete len:367 (+),score=83.96 TRINITY_DN1106_c3_g1_i1:38-1102(+)
MDGWFSKAMESVKKGADQLSDQAKQLSEQVKVQAKDLGVMELIKLDEKTEEKTEEIGVPWEGPPPAQWEERMGQWRVLVKSLLSDPNTFLVGPMGREEGVEGIDWTTEDAPPQFQISCAKDEDFSQTRFTLVPKWVSDKTFWANYYWKIRELGKAEPTNLEKLLRTLNTDPTSPPLAVGERLKHRGVTHETDVIQSILDLVKEQENTDKRLSEMSRSMEEKIKTSEENIALLKRIRGRATPNSSNAALRDSVYESCKYHLQKAEALLQQGMSETANNQRGLPLDRLARAVKDLHNIEAEGSATLEQEDSSPTSTAPKGEDDKPAEQPDANDAKKNEKEKISEDYFGGALPWEEE